MLLRTVSTLNPWPPRDACTLGRLPRPIPPRALALARTLTPPFTPTLTPTFTSAGFNIKLLFRRLATALPNLESSAAPPNDPQVINLTAPPPTAAATAAKGGCAAGCY